MMRTIFLKSLLLLLLMAAVGLTGCPGETDDDDSSDDDDDTGVDDDDDDDDDDITGLPECTGPTVEVVETEPNDGTSEEDLFVVIRCVVRDLITPRGYPR